MARVPWKRHHGPRDVEGGAREPLGSPATLVTVAYLVLASAWIFLSTWAFAALVPPERLPAVETLKGWLFVAVTGGLLWWLLSGYWRTRLELQEQQARSEGKLQAALEDFQAAVLRFRSQEPFEIVSTSAGIGALTQHAPEDLVGTRPRSAVELVHPEDRRALFTAARATARDGRRFVMEIRLLTASGATRWAWCKGLRAGDGDLVEVLLTDISRMKQLESQLVQAQRLEALSDLAAGVAHDVDDFLTTIRGHAERLGTRVGGGRRPDAELAESLAEVMRAARSATALNQRLLRLGRPSGMEADALDLNELVAATVDLLRPMLRRRVHLGWELAPEPVVVHGDARRLEQVLVNLALNARDAMPLGGRLTLGTAAVEVGGPKPEAVAGLPPGRYGCVRVEDTGTGIAPEHLEKLFEPFFTTKGPESGTGLGLAVVAWLVEEHRGRVVVDSTPGVGSRFQVFLPLHRPAEPADPGAGPSPHDEPSSSPVWSFGEPPR